MIISPSEHLVLTELCRDGADNSFIAARLSLSVDTVKTHLQRIRKKAHVHSRTELALDLSRGRLKTRVICRGRVIDHKDVTLKELRAEAL